MRTEVIFVQKFKNTSIVVLDQILIDIIKLEEQENE